MTTPDAAPSRPQLSRDGRRARAGYYGFRPETECGQAQRDAAATVQNVARSLGQQLDAIQNDQIRTPLEKRQAAAAAVASATKQFDFVASKVLAGENELRDRIDQLEHVRRAYESKLSPFDVERLKLKADAIRKAGGDAVLQAWERARRTKNVDDAVMLQIVEPLRGGEAQRLFLEIARPETLASIKRDLAVQQRISADARSLAAGLVELGKADDPHLGSAPSSEDMFAQANAPTPALDATLPLWLGGGQ